MFTIYMAVMALLLAAGVLCTVFATSQLLFGIGLLTITVAGGGLSSGYMTREIRD